MANRTLSHHWNAATATEGSNINLHCGKENSIRSVLGLFVIMSAALCSASRAVPGTPTPSAEGTRGVQVVEVTAKKYEFTPSPIRVKHARATQNYRGGPRTRFQD
jgi:hypothetical protein